MNISILNNKNAKQFKTKSENLGKIGRIKINKKIYKNKWWKNDHYLKGEDLLGILNNLLNIKLKKDDEIDDLKNKKINCLGKLLQNQITIGLTNKRNTIVEKIKEIEAIKNHLKKEDLIEQLKKNDILSEQLKKFFATNPLSQIMEEKNAIAETTQKRRITCLGIGGIKNSQTNLSIREIHPSQYGRICPIETSEGKNAGLILSFVNEYNLNSEGFLNTPFYL